MQFDLLRAFPYPVLRPGVNDYIEGDIQATIHIEQVASSRDLKAVVEFALSVPEIEALISSHHASYAVVFACRDTYFRCSTKSDLPTFEQIFDGGTLRGEVLIYPYVVAIRAISNFKCPWINPEFGPGPFSFDEGAVLALETPRAIYVDRDAFRPISSSFVLVAKDGLSEHEWRVDPSDDKVKIAVSPNLKNKIDGARNSTRNRAILLNSIYFSAVCQCLSLLKTKDNELVDRRWAAIILQRCADLGIALEHHDEVVVAQQLMKFPFALLETYCFSEAGE